jgi:hypothetical protein
MADLDYVTIRDVVYNAVSQITDVKVPLCRAG